VNKLKHTQYKWIQGIEEHLKIVFMTKVKHMIVREYRVLKSILRLYFFKNQVEQRIVREYQEHPEIVCMNKVEHRIVSEN
jgi:hypothetical protein